MGMKYKYSHWCSVPIDRSELQGKVNELEKALNLADPKKPVAITVTGAKNTTVEFPPEQLAELVAIMKFTMSED